MRWLKIWLLTPALLLLGIGFNEAVLRAANHKPSLVSDADLFCMSYSRLPDLQHQDVVLLGASRMQNDFDLDVFHQRYLNRQVIQLAQSGRGTAFPVFKDLVENSNFNGTVILDENEQTLTSQVQDQQPFVDHCHHNFSLNRRLNRDIGNWLQTRFVFLNPQSSSLRLWGNLIAQRQLPEPFFVETRADRSQFSEFERADPTALKNLHELRMSGMKQMIGQPAPEPQEWLSQTHHWQPLVQQFQARGGQVVFVRMPTSQERWEIESQYMPIDVYWNAFIKSVNTPSLNFAQYPTLTTFDLPDTSHIDALEKAVFTTNLLDQLDKVDPANF